MVDTLTANLRGAGDAVAGPDTATPDIPLGTVTEVQPHPSKTSPDAPASKVRATPARGWPSESVTVACSGATGAPGLTCWSPPEVADTLRATGMAVAPSTTTGVGTDSVTRLQSARSASTDRPLTAVEPAAEAG